MLTKQIRQQIEDFVHQSPRTVQEISQHIDKNWRTADRYIQEISEEFGTIATKTFREGSRGALKLVYWNALVGMKGTAFQERLKTMIEAGRTKYDFSAMYIYQSANTNQRTATLNNSDAKKEFHQLLDNANRQVLLFSGNLSWLQEDPQLEKKLDKLIAKGVKIKIITRVDLTSQKLADNLLKHNTRQNDDMIAIRHCEQPLRGAIIDDVAISIREIYSPNVQQEIKEKTTINYVIKDSVWINWLQKVFWYLWEQSIDAQLRIDAIKTIKK